MRWLTGGIGLLVMLFGLACLNYTKGFDLNHHVQWAGEKGLREPSYGIYLMGALLAVLGAGVVGFTLGRARRKQQSAVG